MKKLIIGLALVSILLSFGGCAKKNDDGGNNNVVGPPVDPENFEFVLNIMNAGAVNRNDGRDFDTYWIYFLWYGGFRDGIENVSLTIDGVTVPMEESMYDDSWFGQVELSTGQSHSVEVSYNNKGTESFELFASENPEIIWPATYDPAIATPLDWTLSMDAENQYLYGWGETGHFDEETYEWVTDEEDEDWKELDPSVRAWTIPANWLTSGLEEYTLELVEFDYFSHGDFLAMISAGSFAQYGYTRDNEQDMRIKTKRIMKLIK